jgi:WhiB family redox-sensing transcriptional regulator
MFNDQFLSDQFRGDQYLGALGDPQIGTGSAFIGTPSVRTHLSLVPDPMDLTLTPGDEDQWQERALCAQTDPEAFFPEKGGSTREAKRICLGCEVKDSCLEYALANDERFGIWGGLSERERRRLKRGII